MQSTYPSWSPYHYVARNPISITDPTGMNWYQSNSGGHNQYTWYDGEEEKEGYKNLGSSSTIEGKRGDYKMYRILLNPDGTAEYGFPFQASDKIGPGTSGETPAGSYIIAREKTPDEQQKEQFNTCLNEKFSNQMSSGAATEMPTFFFDLILIGKSVYTLGSAVYAANAAEGGRVFWSGEGAMDAAMNYAKSTGGTTLEMTRAGQNLQQLIQTKNIPWSEARPMWQRLSAVYAKGANGTVHFFPGTTVNPGSIWMTVEKDILLNKGVKIITH